jgi:hypothetical protein
MNYIIIMYCILAITIILLVLKYKYNKYSNSINYNMETFEPIDRTRLYGSLFLDNLNEQIIRLTDPPIAYDNKRIDIIKYSDVLL